MRAAALPGERLHLVYLAMQHSLSEAGPVISRLASPVPLPLQRPLTFHLQQLHLQTCVRCDLQVLMLYLCALQADYGHVEPTGGCASIEDPSMAVLVCRAQ